ncbi:MAG: DNA (cytosine-5-)-methyltransferase [Chitinophagales bacterium]|nr:DNA (cytosine-5-)-methyltransferase [Chitinophagales bacterium]
MQKNQLSANTARLINYLSLFSGIGGFEKGIGRKATCIGFSEIDPFAIQIYQNQFPNHKNYGDITTIKAETLPDFDLLVGGFPCQSFSIAGNRKGFADRRGHLFFDIARIINIKKPTYLLLENVKGLLSHNKGKTFKIIITTLDELGYDCQWEVLNSKHFGLAQNRQRVYIVGHLRGKPRPEVFPLERANKKSCIQTQALKTLNPKDEHKQQKHPHNQEIPTIKIKEATKTGYAVARVGDSIDVSFPTSTMRRGRIGRQIAHTLITGMQLYTLTKDRKLRRLTPLECERLQGFPDYWTKHGKDPNCNTTEMSDRQRYKSLGNAVGVPVIRTIIKKLLHITKVKHNPNRKHYDKIKRTNTKTTRTFS